MTYWRTLLDLRLLHLLELSLSKPLGRVGTLTAMLLSF
jgi:hypothetical protein